KTNAPFLSYPRESRWISQPSKVPAKTIALKFSPGNALPFASSTVTGTNLVFGSMAAPTPFTLALIGFLSGGGLEAEPLVATEANGSRYAFRRTDTAVDCA